MDLEKQDIRKNLISIELAQVKDSQNYYNKEGKAAVSSFVVI